MTNQTDKAIFSALQAFKDAEARYAARCDVPGDGAELDAAHAASEEATEILRDARPKTTAGVRAVLEWLASDLSLRFDVVNAVAANLLAACPALAA